MRAFILAALILCALAPLAHAERASWYDHGRRTANGEAFHPDGLTAASRTLPFGTMVRVCFHGCVDVRINDRGPFIRGRSIDLSRGAARSIGMIAAGVANVSLQILEWGHAQIRARHRRAVRRHRMLVGAD